MAKVSTNITIDAEVKAKAQALLSDFGMDLSTAVNIFLKQMVYDGAFPFEITRNRRASDAPLAEPCAVGGVSDAEAEEIVSRLGSAFAPWEQDVPASLRDISAPDGASNRPDASECLLLDVLDYAVDSGRISTSMIQRRFGVGYARACRMIDRLEELGYISPAEGNRPRQVNITREVYDRFLSELVQ